jgi:hypothetical protein
VDIALMDKVYVNVKDAAGRAIAYRYLRGEDVPSWLTVRAGPEGVKCDVYDDAPIRGGRVLATFVRRDAKWQEE